MWGKLWANSQPVRGPKNWSYIQEISIYIAQHLAKMGQGKLHIQTIKGGEAWKPKALSGTVMIETDQNRVWSVRTAHC